MFVIFNGRILKGTEQPLTTSLKISKDSKKIAYMEL